MNVLDGTLLVSDRILFIQLNTAPIPTCFVQVYVPTEEVEEDEIERFYNELEDTLKLKKNRKLFFILGDFNAKIGSESIGGYSGTVWLGEKE